MNREQFANMLSLMLGLCALMLGIGVFRRGEINRFTVQVSVLAAAAGMAYLSVIAVVSPYKVDRYIFCIYPLMTAAVWMLMINGLRGMGLKEAISVILVSCALLGADAYTLNTGNVNYLYRGRSRYVDIAEDHGKLPCVLLGSNDLTENLLELGAYDRVFVLGNEDWEQVSPALEAHGGYDPEQGFVLYQRYGDSDIVEKVVEHTGAHQAELLYTHLFDVYRIQ